MISIFSGKNPCDVDELLAGDLKEECSFCESRKAWKFCVLFSFCKHDIQQCL